MSFTVATYNILADAYVRPERYPLTPREVLEPVRRLSALIAHLVELNADVLCLQEVEPATFAAIDTQFKPLGYVGLFSQKGAQKPDGCATFVRSNPFRLAGNMRLAYADGMIRNQASGHVALLVSLEQQGYTLGIANTHLKWDAPGTPRDEQYGYQQAAQLVQERDHHLPGCTAWIICGDLNATPDTDLIAFIKSEGFTFTHDGEAQAPTSTIQGRAKTIDYLFYSAGLSAEPLPLPSIEGHTILPGFEQPSDHIAVAARFDWR